MLNDFQLYCLEILEKAAMNQDHRARKYSNIGSLLLGEISTVQAKINIQCELTKLKHLGVTKSDQELQAHLKTILNMLDAFRHTISFNYIVGFRRKALELYGDLLCNPQDSQVAGKKLLSRLRKFIVSGSETDLTILIDELESRKHFGNTAYQLLNSEVKKWTSQCEQTCKNFTEKVRRGDFPIWNPSINQNCEEIIADAKHIFRAFALKENASPATKAATILLDDVISTTQRALSDPGDEEKVKACKQLTRNLNGHTVFWQRLTGSILMMLGGFACIAGVALLPTLTGVGVLAGGVAALAAGYGLFSHGGKKGLSLHSYDAVREAHYRDVEKRFYERHGEFILRSVDSDNPLIFNWESGMTPI